jgi:hypothetical protein
VLKRMLAITSATVEQDHHIKPTVQRQNVKNPQLLLRLL